MRWVIVAIIFFFLSVGFVRNPLPDENFQLKVSIFNSLKTSKLVMTHNRGEYKIFGDGRVIGQFIESDFINMTLVGGQIKIAVKDKVLGRFSNIRFVGQGYANSFKIKTLQPLSEVRIYEDDLDLRVEGNRIRIINRPELNHYVAGVVESEVGKNAHIEYYKLQAIICRTYALSNINKYADLGFNLCDEVNSQVYKGKSRSNPDILKATAATSGLVLIDNELNLITAAFHSNSGGQTMNSEDVWSKPVHYLRSVQDTFCLTEPHAFWTKTIATKDWFKYFETKFGLDIGKEENQKLLTSYHQEQRDVYFTEKEIPLKTVRRDWQLNSTFFSIEQKQDSVVLNGKGFGHGVGLCQEGAMRMAREGYSYKTILNKYYKNVNLVNLRALRFAMDEQ